MNLRIALLNLVDRLDEGVDPKLVEQWIRDLAREFDKPAPTFPTNLPTATRSGAV